jgi:N-acetylglucosaminyl-diphospho-decaprenol L-rhamnosyltransferase
MAEREYSADPLIDVVIVTARGSWELLRDCLESLRREPAAAGSLAVTVVDNASGDGTVEAVAEHFPEAAVDARADNRGFAHGCNLGIARGHAPFILLLNPDTIVEPGALQALLETLNRHPQAGAVGPRLLGLDGSADHNAKRSFPSPAGAIRHFAGIQGDYRRDDIPEAGEGVVDAISGSCMLVRRAAAEVVGPLDEAYWMYGEDLDWCARLQQHGWEVRYQGAATVIHVKHGITGRHRALRTNWAFHRSMGRFYRRFGAGEHPLLDAVVYAGVLAKFAVSAGRSAVARRRLP